MHLLGLRANGDCCMSSYPVLPRKTGALSRSPAGILTEAAYRKQVWTSIGVLERLSTEEHTTRNIPRVFPVTPGYT